MNDTELSGRRGERLIGAVSAFFVACACACAVAACGSSTSAEGAAKGGGSNAGGSSLDADRASNDRDSSALAEAASDRASAEAEPAFPNGDARIGDAAPADPASRDASREAAMFNGVAKIMVLGSSNEAITCWRAFLWQRLRDAKITNFDLIGSQTVGPDCGIAGYDKDCEARSGTIITSISPATYRGWFAAHPPDVVLMHIGGADLLNNIPTPDVIKSYTVIVEQARAVSPGVIFLVAQHTPQEPNGCADCRVNVITLNTAIPGWAMQITTAQSPVSPVDLFTGLDVVTDFSDRVHLNLAGSQKVSDRWLAALVPLFR